MSEATKKTRTALLGGLKSGALEKAVAKMEEDQAAGLLDAPAETPNLVPAKPTATGSASDRVRAVSIP